MAQRSESRGSAVLFAMVPNEEILYPARTNSSATPCNIALVRPPIASFHSEPVAEISGSTLQSLLAIVRKGELLCRRDPNHSAFPDPPPQPNLPRAREENYASHASSVPLGSAIWCPTRPRLEVLLSRVHCSETPDAERSTSISRTVTSPLVVRLVHAQLRPAHSPK